MTAQLNKVTHSCLSVKRRENQGLVIAVSEPGKTDVAYVVIRISQIRPSACRIVIISPRHYAITREELLPEGVGL